MDFPDIDGFLGTRAPLVLDVLFLTMFVVVVVLGWSVFQVKYRRRYQLHKWVQIVLAVVLLAAVSVFELDIRTHGWQERSAGTIGGEASPTVKTALSIHLVFAVTTVILWPSVIFRALRKFPNPPAPSLHSTWHIRWGWIAAINMLLTSVTGWIFYWLAFVR
jgi:putative membrane protein